MDGGMERLYLLGEDVPSFENRSLIDVYVGQNLIETIFWSTNLFFHKVWIGNHNIDLHSNEKGFKSTKYNDLLESSVKCALVLGVGTQLLQHA
jgi:hypothetical protein